MLTSKQPDTRNINPILAIISGGRSSKLLSPGIVEIGHFNGEDTMPGEWDKYPTLSCPDPEKYVDCYGVCDNVQQLLDLCPEITDNPDREFFISLTPIVRAEQPSEGGWRWHKWGPYIGTHEPQCEYLYDEQGIDRVFVYHVYEAK